MGRVMILTGKDLAEMRAARDYEEGRREGIREAFVLSGNIIKENRAGMSDEHIAAKYDCGINIVRTLLGHEQHTD